jgi:transcription elongation factor GreA
VTVKDLEEGFEDEYMIVGPAEASPAEGKISHESCMGAAMMGRSAGETISVNSTGGIFSYEILSVQ